MKYIGNKTRLLGFIDEVILKEKLPTKGTFIDIFTGTTSVAEHFKKKNYRIICNDFMTYSYVYQRAFIRNPKRYLIFQKLWHQFYHLYVKKFIKD